MGHDTAAEVAVTAEVGTITVGDMVVDMMLIKGNKMRMVDNKVVVVMVAAVRSRRRFFPL